MNTLGALVLAALATAIAFPSGPTGPPIISQLPYGKANAKAHQPRPFLRDYVLPRMLLSNPTYRFEDSPRIMPAPQPRDNYWLNKEIERLNQMQAEEVGMSRFEREFPRWMARDPYFTRPYIPLRPRGNPNNVPDFMTSISKEEPLLPYIPAMKKDMTHPEPRVMEHKVNKESFAMTPLDTGYYEPEPTIMKPETDDHHEGNILTKTIIYERPRQTRQNPIGRTKNLVTGDLEKLRIGFTNQPDSTDKPNFHQPVEATESFFGVALMAAMGGVFTIAIFGFAFAWYTLNKKAKAAADIDYPAYGVTGPNIDSSGDRKLAHSAHMYHYQHQKQQIIAMERNGMEQRNGSVSDPESEEENEEGDYTVYECPGFATTGEMEVKNPLFSEDPTPATPGKCELVKPQPKE